jgi:hypothetical protein
MAYTRKTYDTWEIQGLYNGKWEMETVELSRKSANETRTLYRENMPHYPHRIIKKRVSK